MSGLDTVVIYNPKSGDGSLDPRVLELGAEPGFELWHVEAGENPRLLAARARQMGARRVAAAGGDGTVNAVVNGLLSEDCGPLPIFAVLPCGSANDFTKALGMGPDWERAVEALAGGVTCQLDLMRVRGGDVDVLVNAATGGFSVEIDDHMDEDTKRWWGGYAYARTALEVMPEARDYRVRIEADGLALGGEFNAVILCNGSHAGGVCLVPPADTCDGHLDLAGVFTTTLAERLRLLADFAVAQHLESERVVYRRVRQVRVDSDPPMPFIGDGERLGETPLTFEVMPGVLEVLVPPEA